jgi:fructan beta-fructosidase
MIRFALFSLLLLLIACSNPSPSKVSFDERYRPQYHFTPERNWMNDPNGLIYYEGEYHLFFQHNPKGNTWGHLSWGHAVSTDLVNWRELPVAIPERDVMIFSGSAVLDASNTSGLGQSGKPALIAIYTGYNPKNHVENQYLSFSFDRGRTWQEYQGNPILEPGRSGMFRDPKVFWHAGTQRWVMTVSRGNERVVSFFVSQNLLDWHEVSSFGPAGEAGGPWEVPELFEVPVDGGGKRWVLVVGVTGGAGISGGSGVQYFVGDFDGEKFTQDGNVRAGGARWVDQGADFYAPQTWSGIPESDGRRIWVGWLANTRYANEQPTNPWRGMLTIPRTVHLVRSGDGYVLAQRPVQELEQLRGLHLTIPPGEFAAGETAVTELSQLGDAIEIELGFHIDEGSVGGLLLNFGRSELRVGYDAVAGHVFVDRRRGGRFKKGGFAALHTFPVAADDGHVNLRIFLDRSSIEVFAQGGTAVITDLIFPDSPFQKGALFAPSSGMRLTSFNAWSLSTMNRTGAGPSSVEKSLDSEITP